MKRFICLALACLLASCASVPLIGGESEDVLTGSDESYTVRLAPGWSIRDRGTPSPPGEAPGRTAYLAHADAAKTEGGYPTLVVREVREKTPRGLLAAMDKDKGLDLGELWGVGKDAYQLKQSLLGDEGRRLTYWLSPKNASGVEYYACVVLTGFGRLEMIGVTQAGTASRYLRDFNAMFASVRLSGHGVWRPGEEGDLSAYLTGVYRKALSREAEALARQAAQTPALAADAQERNILGGAYAKGVKNAQEASDTLVRMLAAGAYPSKKAEDAARWNRLTESLDDAATALETIALNLRSGQSRQAVEKTLSRVRKLAALSREVTRLPL